MLCPPLPWQGPTGGGYLLGIGRPRHLVSRGGEPSRNAQREALTNDPPSTVLVAINAIQAVPFEINPHVLAIAREASDHGISLACLPQSFIEPVRSPKRADFQSLPSSTSLTVVSDSGRCSAISGQRARTPWLPSMGSSNHTS